MGESEDKESQLELDVDATVIEDVVDAEDAAKLDVIAPDELALLAADLESEDTEPAEVIAAIPESTDADETPDAVTPDDVTPDAVTPDDVTASFDDIPVAPSATAPDATEARSRPSVPWWPFLAYLGAWIVLAGVATWKLMQLPALAVAYESPAYGMMILGGLIMTAVGPLLILAVWLGVRSTRSAGDRAGLLTSSLLKGALVTLCGAIIWWAGLVIVDVLRLGTPL